MPPTHQTEYKNSADVGVITIYWVNTGVGATQNYGVGQA
jgi:hypothetical protein